MSDFIEIQIEDSLSRETLMSIDSTNQKEDIKIAFTFFCLFAFNIIINSLIQPVFISNYNIFQVNSSPTMKYEATFQRPFYLNPRFPISLSILFKKRTMKEKLTLPINMSLVISIIQANNATFLQKNFTHDFHFEPNKDTSDSLVIFDHFSNSFDECSISAQLKTKTQELTDISFKWYYYEIVYFEYVGFIRCIYFSLTLLMLIIYLYHITSISFKFWHMEQKITLFLLISTLIGTNPFQIRIFWTNNIPSAFDFSLHQFLIIFIQFFILSLIDSMRYKNRNISSIFFINKLTFSFVSIIFRIGPYLFPFSSFPLLKYLYKDFNKAVEINFINNPIVLLLDLIYIVWSLFIYFSAISSVDVIEYFKLRVYIFVSLLLLFIIIVSIILTYYLNVGMKIILISAENIFAILMSVFHWPYETFKDNYYDEQIDNESSPIQSLMIQED